jgi:hypothetical protein
METLLKREVTSENLGRIQRGPESLEDTLEPASRQAVSRSLSPLADNHAPSHRDFFAVILTLSEAEWGTCGVDCGVIDVDLAVVAYVRAVKVVVVSDAVEIKLVNMEVTTDKTQKVDILLVAERCIVAVDRTFSQSRPERCP